MDASRLLLEVRDLSVHFPLDEGTVRAVDGLSYTLARGRTLGVVGESGCGKTVTAQSIPAHPAQARTHRAWRDHLPHAHRSKR